MRKVSNLELNEEKQLAIPKIPTQKNKIIISNVQNEEEEELKNFLNTGIKDDVIIII